MTMLDNERDYDSRTRTTRSGMVDDGLGTPHTTSYTGTRSTGRNTALFEGKDMAALGVIAVMMLGPLLAVTLGFGG